MQYRPLGRTGLQVSCLCLGAMMFGWRTSEDDAANIMSAAYDAGINLVDTSNSYGRGWSEEIVGKSIQSTGLRDRLIVATKVHFPVDTDDPNSGGNSRRHIIEQCEKSLSRLNTDWIDLYQIHHPQPSIPIDETLRALDDLIHTGKVRYIGTSSFSAWQIVESLWASKEYRLNRFVCEQPPYNLLERRAELELFPMAKTFGIGLLTWSPLAQGILSGKYKIHTPYPEDSRFAAITKPGKYGTRLCPAVLSIVDKLKRLAKTKNCTPTQLALAWILSRPEISGVLIGPSNVSQLHDNLGALAIELSAADHALLDKVAPPGGVTSPYYDSFFGPHPHRI